MRRAEPPWPGLVGPEGLLHDQVTPMCAADPNGELAHALLAELVPDLRLPSSLLAASDPDPQVAAA